MSNETGDKYLFTTQTPDAVPADRIQEAGNFLATIWERPVHVYKLVMIIPPLNKNVPH